MTNAVQQDNNSASENKLVLKYREPTGEVNDKGEAVYSKSVRLGELKRAESKSTKKVFFVANDEQGNTYYISKSNKNKIGPRDPSHVLTVRPAGAPEDQTTIICGLFQAMQEGGVKVLKGKNRDTGIKYGIYPEGGERKSSVRAATTEDLF